MSGGKLDLQRIRRVIRGVAARPFQMCSHHQPKQDVSELRVFDEARRS